MHCAVETLHTKLNCTGIIYTNLNILTYVMKIPGKMGWMDLKGQIEKKTELDFHVKKH